MGCMSSKAGDTKAPDAQPKAGEKTEAPIQKAASQVAEKAGAAVASATSGVKEAVETQVDAAAEKVKDAINSAVPGTEAPAAPAEADPPAEEVEGEKKQVSVEMSSPPPLKAPPPAPQPKGNTTGEGDE